MRRGSGRASRWRAAVLCGAAVLVGRAQSAYANLGADTTLQSTASADGLVERTLSFLGFAQNESLCAWRLTLRRHVGAQWLDTSSVVLVLKLEDSTLVAVYRDQPPRRTTRFGHTISTAPGILARQAPEYRHALPQAAWARLRRKAKLSTLQVDFSDGTVRLQPDADSHLHAEAKNKVLHVTTDAEQPMGFGVVARLFDGNLLPLGSFRAPGAPGVTTQAEVQVYFSHTGHSMAVLTHFIGEHVPPDAAYRASSVQHREAPIGLFHIGMRRRLAEDGRSVQQMFEDMHPGGAKDWQVNIGTLF